MKRSPPKTRGSREKAARAADRFARQFHSHAFVEWMRAKPCCCEKCDGRGSDPSKGWQRFYVGLPYSESHHVVSRGAGGTWRDVIPLSTACHSEFHQKGRLSFCQARGWPLERLSELAAGYAREWEARLESGREQEAEAGSR